MKKILTFFVIIIAILGIIWYIYVEAKISENQKIGFNNYYEQLKDKEINGSELASIINKVIDYNEKNETEKDNNGVYISNDENSLNLEIKFKDNDNIIKSEKIYSVGMQQFIELYRTSSFKLSKITYHSKSKLIKYLYFEEV